MSNLKFLFQKEERRDNYPPFELPEISKRGQKNNLCGHSVFKINNNIPSKNPASL